MYLKRVRGLIVEDVFLIQRLIKRYLEPYADVREAGNGTQALSLFTEYFFRGEPFQFITLDIFLPDMDGIEVLRRIRQFEDELHLAPEDKIKVIVITSITHPDKINMIKQLGTDAYITKPFDQETIDKALKSLNMI